MDYWTIMIMEWSPNYSEAITIIPISCYFTYLPYYTSATAIKGKSSCYLILDFKTPIRLKTGFLLPN